MPVLIPSFCGHATWTSSTALIKALSTMPAAVTAHAKIRLQDQTANTPMKPTALPAAASSTLHYQLCFGHGNVLGSGLCTNCIDTFAGPNCEFFDTATCDGNGEAPSPRLRLANAIATMDLKTRPKLCNTCSQNVVDGGGGSSSDRCSECQVEILAASFPSCNIPACSIKSNGQTRKSKYQRFYKGGGGVEC